MAGDGFHPGGRRARAVERLSAAPGGMNSQEKAKAQAFPASSAVPGVHSPYYGGEVFAELGEVLPDGFWGVIF